MDKKKSILIVDDEDHNRILLKESLFGYDYNIIFAVNGEDALQKVQENLPDIILLDINMPRVDGFGVLQKLKEDENTKYIPVIMVTALADINSRIKAKDLGADDFINKPFNIIEVQVRVRNLLKVKEYYDFLKDTNVILEEKVKIRTAQLHQSNLDTLYRLSLAAEYRDDGTGMHALRIGNYSEIIAKGLGMSDEDIEVIKYSSPMHDIGKIGIPDNILLKPAKLTKEEFEIIKTHTIIGKEILSNSISKYIQIAEEIAISHHEKYDGSGYPNNLKAEEIPIAGRIVAICDVFDALVSKRVYKDAFSIDKALEIIKESSGNHFDPDIVEIFLENIDYIIKVKEAMQ